MSSAYSGDRINCNSYPTITRTFQWRESLRPYLLDLLILVGLRVVLVTERRSFSVGELEDFIENVIESHLFLVGVERLRSETVA